MPEEYAHWTLAEKVYLTIEYPDLKSLIAENKSLYELGVGVSDTPFYSVLGRRMREFLLAGRRLHGQDGENTFSFLAALRDYSDLQKNNQAWAFLLGAITHIVADSQFHPFVYYLSGNPLFSKAFPLSPSCHRRNVRTIHS